MLTQKDLDQIEELTREIVREEVRYLPNKDEFFGKMDEVMGELQKTREEVTVAIGKNRDYEDRITNLEELHPNGKHPTQAPNS